MRTLSINIITISFCHTCVHRRCSSVTSVSLYYPNAIHRSSKQCVSCYDNELVPDSSLAIHEYKQVAAVLTVKGRIAAATNQIRLRISTAHQIFPTLYNGLGDVTPKLSFPWRDPVPHLIHASLDPPESIPKWHLDWFSCFVGLIAVTNRCTNTHRPRYIYSNRLHLCTLCMECGLKMSAVQHICGKPDSPLLCRSLSEHSVTSAAFE